MVCGLMGYGGVVGGRVVRGEMDAGKMPMWLRNQRNSRHGADFGLFLGFVAEAFGEELVHEGLFQLGGGLNDPLLRFDRPLHRRKDVRDLLLLGEGGEMRNSASSSPAPISRNAVARSSSRIANTAERAPTPSGPWR